MRLLQVSMVLSIILVENVISRRCNRMEHQNAIMAALQGVMGPKNYERAVAAMPRVEKSVPVVPQPPAAIPREINLPNARLLEQKYPCQMERMIQMENVPQIPNLLIYPTAPAPAMPLPQMLYLQHTPEIALSNSYSVPTPVFERRGTRTCVGPTPVPIINPLLPAASPVSAYAPPTSNLLPPVDPSQVRSHFLRKIPIPPPTL